MQLHAWKTCDASLGLSPVYLPLLMQPQQHSDGLGARTARIHQHALPAGLVVLSLLAPFLLLALLVCIALITAAVRYLTDSNVRNRHSTSTAPRPASAHSNTSRTASAVDPSNDAGGTTHQGPAMVQQDDNTSTSAAVTTTATAAAAAAAAAAKSVYTANSTCSSAVSTGIRRRAVGAASASHSSSGDSSTDIPCAAIIPHSSSSTAGSSTHSSSGTSPFEAAQQQQQQHTASFTAAAAAAPVPALGSADWVKQIKAAAGKGDLTRLQLLLAASNTTTTSSSSSSSSGNVGSSSSLAPGFNRSTVLAEALHEALWQHQEATVQLLLTAGASATATTDSSDNTPLHLAARQGCEGAARALLAAGGRTRATNKYLHTPLHSAAAFGHAAIAKLLLLQGASVDAVSREGASALTEAVQGNHPAVVTSLLSHGADPLLADVNLKTPLYWAAVQGSRKVTQLLCDHMDGTPTTAAGAAAAAAAASAAATIISSSRSGRSKAQVVSAIRSCALAAFSHNHLPTFAVLIKELAKRDAEGVPRLFDALGAHSSAAAAAVAVAWAEHVTQQDGERSELQAQAASVVAERMASQQLLLAVASAAKHLEGQQSRSLSQGPRGQSFTVLQGACVLEEEL